MIGGAREKIGQCCSREKEGKGSIVVPSTPNGGGEGKEDEVVWDLTLIIFCLFILSKQPSKSFSKVSFVSRFLIPSNGD